MTLANLEKTFTDEKIFKLQALNNTQNDRIYGVSENRKFPVSLVQQACL